MILTTSSIKCQMVYTFMSTVCSIHLHARKRILANWTQSQKCHTAISFFFVFFLIVMPYWKYKLNTKQTKLMKEVKWRARWKKKPFRLAHNDHYYFYFIFSKYYNWHNLVRTFISYFFFCCCCGIGQLKLYKPDGSTVKTGFFGSSLA